LAPVMSAIVLLKLDKLVPGFFHRFRTLDRLRSTPEVEIRHLMHARHSAVRGAALFRQIFAADVLYRVLTQRLSGIATLL
jgi:hypothetical protein